MTFGGRTLFENASFQVNYGERVALVGANGTGKTTLFSIILKEREPDAGTIERDEWTMVGHLPQEGEALAMRRCWTWPRAAWRNCPSWRSACMNWKRPAMSRARIHGDAREA